MQQVHIYILYIHLTVYRTVVTKGASYRLLLNSKRKTWNNLFMHVVAAEVPQGDIVLQVAIRKPLIKDYKNQY